MPLWKRPAPDEAALEAHRLWADGHLDEALDALVTATKRFPRDAELRLLLGLRMVASGSAAAAEHIMAAITMDPTSPGRLVRAATGLWVLGYVPAARECADRALEVRPADFVYEADLLDVLGCLEWEDGDLAAAEARMRAAVRLEPESEVFAGHLMRVVYESGRRDQARQIRDAEPDNVRRSKWLAEAWDGLDGRSASP